MIWTQGDQYFIKTEGYTVCKIFVSSESIYEAWNGQESLGSYPTAAAAKAECERHARAK